MQTTEAKQQHQTKHKKANKQMSKTNKPAYIHTKNKKNKQTKEMISGNVNNSWEKQQQTLQAHTHTQANKQASKQASKQ